MVLNQLGLQAGASLSWHIIPEIKSIINSFTDDIIREMEIEVSNEDWTPIKCPQPEVKFPGKNTPSKRETERMKETQQDSEVITKSASTITSLFGGVSFENEDDDIEIVESNVSEVEIYTSSSYDWIVAVMTYFIGLNPFSPSVSLSLSVSLSVSLSLCLSVSLSVFLSLCLDLFTLCILLSLR
jgi:hypothetical protein